MKNLLLILTPFLILGINNCFAQKDSAAVKNFDRFYISLTGCMGIPVGEFAEFKTQPFIPTFAPDTSFSSIAGEARTGLTGKLNAYYFFSKHFGCLATIYTGNFKAKEKTFDQMMIQPFHTFEHITYSYNTKAWKVSGCMVGFTGSLPISKFVFSIKLLSGWQQSITPATEFVTIRENIIDDYKNTNRYSQASVSSAGLGWDAGIDIRIKTGKKINFLLSADYIAAKTDFNYNIVAKREYGTYYTPVHIFVKDEASFSFSETKQISFFSLNAGIAYVFK
jgi:hypothetical protein